MVLAKTRRPYCNGSSCHRNLLPNFTAHKPNIFDFYMWKQGQIYGEQGDLAPTKKAPTMFMSLVICMTCACH